MASRLEEDLCCPICHEIFKDPVSLSCSHSFCRDCLQSSWKEKKNQECPKCRRKSSKDFLLPDFALKRQDLCSLHSEKLTLFCLDHQELVCVVCRDSETHTDHTVRPMDEAVLQHRTKLQDSLQPLKDKLKVCEQARVKFDQTAEYIQVQAQQTERQIREQFRKLHHFLEEEEEARLHALREEEEQKRQRMKDEMEALSREIAALSDEIRATEEELMSEDVSFLTNYKASVERVQQRPLLEDPQLPLGALMDVAKHLGNLGFNIWNKMKDKVSYWPFILDLNTAHSELILSDDLTSVRRTTKRQLPDNPERLKLFIVLGSESFNSGSHSWVVEVGESTRWSLGVLSGSVQGKEFVQSRSWLIRFFNGQYTASSSSDPPTVIRVEKPKRIRMDLDYDRGELMFSNPDTDAHIHTFIHTFTERLYPHIRTADEVPLTILPVNVSVAVGKKK
ncbi:nuclear factor 7, brain-like [Cheilinus undulatus]|uniref:nuclear factor 7, brain-like n=1 Tax=Cheilinus undulatus TaxID=241271 RepID=UPI001BD3CD23|nr:nuclear factor 7, brain-like [Cheilinus undulatus]